MAQKPTTELIGNTTELIVDQPLAPPDQEQQLSKRFRLLGAQGLVGMSLLPHTLHKKSGHKTAKETRVSNDPDI